MDKTTWEGKYPTELRNSIISICKHLGVDFEKEFISEGHTSTDSTKNELSSWMRRAAAAEFAKCSVDTIDNLLRDGLVRRAKLSDSGPGRVLIDRDSLENFIKSKVSKPTKRVRKQAPSVEGGYRVQSSK